MSKKSRKKNLNKKEANKKQVIFQKKSNIDYSISENYKDYLFLKNYTYNCRKINEYFYEVTILSGKKIIITSNLFKKVFDSTSVA